MREQSHRESGDAKIRSLAKRQHGTIARHQAIDLGMSNSAIGRRTGSGEWERVHPGVYRLHPSADRWRQDLWAANLWLGEGAVVSHRAAALLHRITSHEHAAVEFSVPACLYRGPAQTRGVTLHRPAPEARETMNIEGLRVTKLPRTLLDLGAVMDDDDVEKMVETALHRGRVTIEELENQLTRHSRQGRRGAGALRAVLERRGHAPAVESHLELEFLRFLRTHGFLEPERQVWIRRGDFKARVDFAYTNLGLVIEIAGFDPHGRRESFDNDHARSNQITALGLDVLQITKAHLRDEITLINVLDALGVPRQMRLRAT